MCSTHAYILLAVLYMCKVSADSVSKECLSSKLQYQTHLATKTPYRFIANYNDSLVSYEGCDAQQMWMIVRHGTRNPGKKLIDKMRDKLTVIRDRLLKAQEDSKLCSDEVEALRKWQPAADLDDKKKFLTHEGEEELLLLAERMQKRFPSILPEVYDNGTYKFRYTATQRAELSAKYFAIGLFGRQISQHVWYPEALHRDPILRFYKGCLKWRVEVDKNPKTTVERRLFEGTSKMKNLVVEVNERLGLLAGSLNIGDIYTMYTTCGFETSWNKLKPSPWCAVFTTSDLILLEYAEDLEYYWIDGYGHELTYKQACATMKDMFEHIDKSNHKSTVYFTHSGTLLKFLAHLGLYRDEDPLTHKMKSTRKWRVSQIDAFGTNVAFIKFRCGDTDKVLVLHQERQVIIPGCPEDDLCPLSKLKEIFADSISNCDIDAMCYKPQTSD